MDERNTFSPQATLPDGYADRLHKGFDFAAEALRISQDQAAMVRAGIEAGKRIAESEKDAALRTIIAARDMNPDVLIPTPLLAAIENARRIIG